MTVASASFLRDARGRLLPPSIPFRYFGSAVVYHVLAWVALFAGARDVPRFTGGLGWPLAALHLVTLGVLVMVALGASAQILPVATRGGAGSTRLPALVWWIYTPGVGLLALGMGLAALPLLAAGAAAVVLALAAFAGLLARNLAGGRGMPTVLAHGWSSLACLGVALAGALALVGLYLGRPLAPYAAARAVHAVFATYGFMGLLAAGLSYIVVPMFALGPPPPDREGLASCILALVALLLAGASAGSAQPSLLGAAAAAAGLAAFTLYVHCMHITLRDGMRRRLGRSFALVRVAWACLGASLVTGLGLALEVPVAGLATLFGLLVAGGWLLTFALGILQRIVPFLASMHAARGKGLPPAPSALTAADPLALHYRAHLGALALLAAAIVSDSPFAAAMAAALGALGACAFAAFYAVSLGRMARAGTRAA